jgi:hypothetical protein
MNEEFNPVGSISNKQTNPVLGAIKHREAETSIQENINKFGYAFIGINNIDDDNPQPAYVYTVGLISMGFPELFLSGNMSQKTAMGIMNQVINLWRTEGQVRTGRINNFLGVKNAKLPIGLVAVDGDSSGLTHLIEFKKYFPAFKLEVVQVLWSDEKGYLPNNSGYTQSTEYEQFFLPKV